MLEVRHLSHSFGETQVLFDLSFTLREGEILGFLGPNGAGKSTTMRIVTGFLTPTSGEVRFNGRDIRREPMALRRQLGYLPENVPLYPELKVREFLSWAARVKQAADPAGQVAEVAERCGLEPVMGKLVGHLSRGFRQRVGLAQAILGDSRLLVLDEPTAAMDPAQIVAIRELIKDLGRSRTILLSTHILPEVERTCDRVLILDQGRILAEDTPAGLTDRFGGRGIFLLRVDPGVETAAEVEAALAEAPGVTSTSRLDDGLGGVLVRLETESGRDRRAELTSLAFGRGWSVLEFRPAHASLEDAFVSIVRREEVAA